MRIRLLHDAEETLHAAGGRAVVLAYRQGEEVEVADALGNLFISDGMAVAVTGSERAIAPRGEIR